MNIIDIAIAKGYTEESLTGAGALKGQDGKDGADGKGAYELAVEKGFEGSDDEWLESLKGADGKDGENGKDGIDGIDGQNGKDGLDGEQNVIESISVNGTPLEPDENKNVDITVSSTDYTAGTGIKISEDKIISTKDVKKNYIDNSNFRINQTGASEYSTANEYTVDRWYIDGGILTPVENGVQFVNPNTETGASNLVRLRQNIHYGFAEFAGKTVTLSAKINGVVYSGKAIIPTEKPTEGTATQYITSGITDFSINLNYSVTADYFVPYIALAYNRTALIEWMKLEVNDEFSGYIEPDYMTELIKMNFTTSDKGALDIPTGGESYDDTEIKEDIATLETSLENKLDKDGSADNLSYSALTSNLKEDPSKEIENDNAIEEVEKYYGEKIIETLIDSIGAPTCIKELDDKILIGGRTGFGYYDKNFTTFTPIVENNNDLNGMGGVKDIVITSNNEYYVITPTRTKPFLFDNNGIVSNDWVTDSTGATPLYCSVGSYTNYAFFLNKQTNIIYSVNSYSFTEDYDLNEIHTLPSNGLIKKLEKNECYFLVYPEDIIYCQGIFRYSLQDALALDVTLIDAMGGSLIVNGFLSDNALFIINDHLEIYKVNFDYEKGNIKNYASLEFIGDCGGVYAQDPKTIFYSKNDRFYYAFAGVDIFKFDIQKESSFYQCGRIQIGIDNSVNPLEYPSSSCIFSDDNTFNIGIVTSGPIIDFKFEFEFENKSVSEALTKVSDYDERMILLEEIIHEFERRLSDAGL